MEENDNVELIQLAIQRLIEEDKKKKKKKRDISSGAMTDDDDDDDDDHILLSRLLSQLESLKGDDILLQRHEPLSEEEMEVNSPGVVVGEEVKKSEGVGEEVDDASIEEEEEVKKDDIVKELRNLKKQNMITHCLLSVMIVLTLAWQLSEVSLILKIKNGLNPFKSFGNLFNGIFKRPGKIAEDWSKESSSAKQPKIEVASIPPIQILELPNMDLSSLGLNGHED